ncbi:MAG TPA: ABC transporter permease [Candidatus Saccharimonadales bacterium]|nr:ABC transporter permease [Candidatus Saccharimonadales bacterium]
MSAPRPPDLPLPARRPRPGTPPRAASACRPLARWAACAALLAGLAAAPPAGLARAAGAPTPADTLPPLLLSQRAARVAGLRAGEVVRVSADPALRTGRWARVAAVLPFKADPVDVGRGTLWVRLHLSDLARLTGRADEADEVILKARDPGQAGRLRDRLNALSGGYRAYTSEELAERTSQTFEVVSRFHRAISLITLAAGAVFLLAILLFKVEERRHELGALRLIGVRRRSLTLFVCAEALAISVLGSLAGLGLGRLAAAAVNAYYQRYYDTTLVFAAVTPAVAWTSLALGAAFGLGTGLAVALRLARVPALKLLGR